MKTIKQYAEDHHVSYEAIRMQIKRHSKELEGHLKEEGSGRSKKTYIDDEGIAILDEIRGGNPVIIVNTSKDEEIQALKMQNEALKNKIIELQDTIIRHDEEYKLLQNKYTALLEAPKETDAQEATEDVAADEATLSTTEEESTTQAVVEAQEAKEEAKATFKERFHFVFFGKRKKEGGTEA